MKTIKLRKVGNSVGLVLPKDVLDRLNVSEGDELHLAEIEGALRLSPYDDEFDKQLAIARKGMSKYRNALRTLAK